MSFRKTPTQWLSVFFYMFAGLPLIYLPDRPELSRDIRMVALIVLTALVMLADSSRRQFFANCRQLPPIVKVCLSTIVVLMLASTFKMMQDTFGVTLFGKAPDYLGVMTWLLFLGFGIAFMRDAIRLLLSRVSLYIFLLIICISLFTNIFYITHGLRVAGVMFQPTTMAMYAAFGAVICLHQFRSKQKDRITQVMAGLGLLLSTATVMLCQSRVSYIVLAICLSAVALHDIKKRPKQTVLLSLLVVVIAALPHLRPGFFERFQSDSVNRGASYRFELYKTSVPDLARHNIVLGNGPGSLPIAINNPTVVPEEIAATLKQGESFASTHDLFLDYAYFFGCLAMILLMGGSVLAVKTGYLTPGPLRLGGLLLFFALFSNALLNIPSIELTSLYFVVVLGLIGSGFKVTQLKKHIGS